MPPLAHVFGCGKGGTRVWRKLVVDMHKGNYIAASFPLMSYATGAIDWFRNQAIDPDAIVVAAVPPGGQPRAPQRGDNARSDLRWIVALDLDAARIPRDVAAEALRREGGKLLAQIPDLPQSVKLEAVKRT
ncbi:MAG: hypothetical protein M3Z41_02940 [Candidatus Eremiobacteraeota bacterium]|nr:hypothetical protein [Candidatus Eremiobacteraeota bacterium]